MIGAKMAGLFQRGGDRRSAKFNQSPDGLKPGPNPTAREAAGIVGVGSAQVSRALKVIRSEDEEMIGSVERGAMTIGHLMNRL